MAVSPSKRPVAMETQWIVFLMGTLRFVFIFIASKISRRYEMRTQRIAMAARNHIWKISCCPHSARQAGHHKKQVQTSECTFLHIRRCKFVHYGQRDSQRACSGPSKRRRTTRAEEL